MGFTIEAGVWYPLEDYYKITNMRNAIKTMNNITPGNWYYEGVNEEDQRGRVLCDDERRTIIHIPPGSPNNPQCMADAKLIAVAPKMLKIIDALSGSVGNWGEKWLNDLARDADDIMEKLK